MANSRSVLFALLVFDAIGRVTATAQTGKVPAATVRRLDAIAGAGVAEKRAVGIVAAVARGQETLLLQAYGRADAEKNVPLTPDTVIAVGSVTKQFTAAAILQLRDQGRLALDDDVTKWLPDFQTGGNKITLRHLLHHTGGIQEFGQMPELRAMQLMMNRSATTDDVYKVVKGYPPKFPAGTMQMYSNTGYWLLGRVIEKASGLTYEDYIEKRIFAPLKMSRSMYCDTTEDVPNRAVGHGIKGDVIRRAPDIVHTATNSAGAICSTAGDLITWLQALHGGKVLATKSYAELIAPARLNDGTTTRYGMGSTVSEDSNGLQYIGHNGGGFGFSSETRWYPETRLAAVVLTNSEPDEITMVIESLVAEVLPVPRPLDPFTGDGSLLVGTYKGPGPAREMVVEVTQAPRGLQFSVNGGAPAPLPWVDHWTFRSKALLLTFRRTGNAGPAEELRFDTGGDHLILKRQ